MSEIESIGDGCFNVAKTLQRKNQNHVEFNDGVMKEIDQMFDMVAKAMTNMLAILDEMERPESSRIVEAYNKEREITILLIGEAEKLADYMLNVVEGVKHQFKSAPETAGA